MSETPNNATQLKVFLAILATTVLIYTVYTIINHGSNFFGAAFEFLTSGDWSGQFTADFTTYLLLSALWVMWRNKFSANAILIGVVVSILGIIVFAPYVIYLLNLEKGDMKKVLVGDR